MTRKPLLWLTLTLLVAAAPAAAGGEGFLYGTVESESGNTYRGFLRWGTEEAFWDDHFNSTKKGLKYADRIPEDQRDRREIDLFGVTIGWRSDHSRGSRALILRYGDIREIEPAGGDRARVTLKNGSVLDLDGGSNDLGASVTVRDESLGEVKLRWREIARIVFSPAPASADPPASRLYGRLTATDEVYRGYIQWDLQECLSTDELDGETEDGDVSIQMGKIKSIEKRNKRGAWVELWDGRRLLLEGTNDVDSSIDGIFVEDERYGRVELDWDTFERLDFEAVSSSGRGYDDYLPARALTGTVKDRDGGRHSGRIVFDLDESETWESLDGKRGDVEFHIPFERVASIERLSGDASRVVLRGGVELELEDTQDVSDRNDGVIVLGDGGGETYVSWREVERIDFDDRMAPAAGRAEREPGR